MYQTENPDVPLDLEGMIPQVLNQDENDKLIKIPDPEEIINTLNQMPDLKTPGPDGLPRLFYSHYWSTMGRLFIETVQKFFQTGFLLKELNNTFITLIPKNMGANSFNDFRPISLSNVIYKVISKILANRLKPRLEKIVSPNQTAFMEGRWINENGLLAQEIIQVMRNSRARRGWVGIKIDFAKAFDRIEWPFILLILKNMGFHHTFINWIHQCISTTSLSVLINGTPKGFFKPSRGLRQGDPLSPYLFILGMEVLSRMLYRAENENLIKGVKIGRNGPPISHLMFSDDLLITLRASQSKIKHCKLIFRQIQQVVRTADKLCQIRNFFSRKTTAKIRKEIKTILNIKKLKLDSKYLGNPMFIKRNRSESFSF